MDLYKFPVGHGDTPKFSVPAELGFDFSSLSEIYTSSFMQLF